ncbi:MAG: hypothetical protein H7Y18_21155 [Clostridiaceae bacterium]|nr:hypothetical protein [Clostridiaceae bacterium]
MEEERFSCYNPMNKSCNYCQQNHTQEVYMYPFPGLPFGFENMWDEDECDKDDYYQKHCNSRESENLDEVEDIDDLSRAVYNADEILYRIERTNPMMLRRITMSGIPYKSARNIVRQIIYLTLSYSQK